MVLSPLQTLPPGGGGDVATDPIWDAAGDLAVGTGADTAARLGIGAAHSVVQTLDGITPSWQTAPELQFIKATDGTTRITTTTAGLLGGVRLDGSVGINRGPFWHTTLGVAMTGALGAITGTMNGIDVLTSAFSIINSNKTVTIFRGAPVVQFNTDAAVGLILDGMNFQPVAALGAGVSATFPRISGLSAQPGMVAPGGETITVGLFAGLHLPAPTNWGGLGTAVITDAVGVDIGDYGNAAAATALGLRIANVTAGTIRRLIEAIGATQTNLRVEAGDPGANLTQVLISINNGAVVSRRVEIGAANSGGAGFRMLRVAN